MILMDEFSVALKRFGDDQSTLLDQFERLSFEVQLNQAMLGRSLSEPVLLGQPRFKTPPPPALLMTRSLKQGRRRRRGGGSSSLRKVLKKLRHIFSRNGATVTKGSKAEDDDDDGVVVRREVSDPKNLTSWKAFGRSLRL